MLHRKPKTGNPICTSQAQKQLRSEPTSRQTKQHQQVKQPRLQKATRTDLAVVGFERREHRQHVVPQQTQMPSRACKPQSKRNGRETATSRLSHAARKSQRQAVSFAKSSMSGRETAQSERTIKNNQALPHVAAAQVHLAGPERPHPDKKINNDEINHDCDQLSQTAASRKTPSNHTDDAIERHSLEIQSEGEPTC
jgi:hypothetical protein